MLESGESGVPTCTWIIAGLCGVVVSLSAYIVSLHKEIKEILKDWIKNTTDELHMLNLVQRADRTSGSGPEGGKK